jgi:hypothetical protein
MFDRLEVGRFLRRRGASGGTRPGLTLGRPVPSAATPLWCPVLRPRSTPGRFEDPSSKCSLVLAASRSWAVGAGSESAAASSAVARWASPDRPECLRTLARLAGRPGMQARPWTSGAPAPDRRVQASCGAAFSGAQRSLRSSRLAASSAAHPGLKAGATQSERPGPTARGRGAARATRCGMQP